MISFLFPALLAALAAVAIPIIIHFFQRRQLKVVPISTLRFLKIAEETLPRQPRMQHLLLLLLRCLLVALLGFFLAKPYFSKRAGANATAQPLHRVVLLDQSLSMSQQGKDATPFGPAKKIAADLTRNLRYQDLVTPIVFDQSPVAVIDPRTPQHGRAAAAFEAATGRLGSTSPRHALQAARRYCDEPSSKRHRNEVIILTDLSRGDVADWLDSIHYVREARDFSRVVLVSCGQETKPNFAITSARLIQPTASSTASHALALQVSAAPPQPFDREIEVTVNDQVLGKLKARSEKGDAVTVEVPLPSVAGGLWRGAAKLVETDPLPDDNQRFFCFKSSRSDRIYLVDGAPSAVRSLSETYYLSVALSALPDERALDVTFGSLDQVPWPNLDRLGTIVFANVAKFTDEQAAQILAFVRGGGNVIFTLGDQVAPDSYNKVLKSSAADGLLPASLGVIKGDPNRRLETFFLGDADPGFDGFNLGNGNADAFRQSRFFGFYELENPDPQSRTLARFNTGEPALIEKSLGDGRVYLFASSLSAVWNDFPLRPTYLPFWRNFLQQLVHLGSPPRQFLVGETARVQLAMRITPTDKLLIIAPDKQNLEPILAADSVLLPDLALPGLYRIVDAGGTERDPGFAVNIPARESQTAPASAEDIAQLKSVGYEVIPATDATAVAGLTKPLEGSGIPLAAWIALLGVIAAAGEWMLGNHLSKEGV